MTRHLVQDERGAVTADWITLSAGIVLLGIMVAFSVMNNSAGYLMSEFDDLNDRFAQDSEALRLSSAPGDESSAAAANAAAAMDAAISLGAANTTGVSIGAASAAAEAGDEDDNGPIIETAIETAPPPVSASGAAREAASTAAIRNRSRAAKPSERANPGAGVPTGSE